MLHDLQTALAFLTILPVGMVEGCKPGYAYGWFPFVGLLLGLTLLALSALLLPASAEVRALLLLLVWVVYTGGLHLDGLADACDGLLATTTPERRLEIMKDPRAGSWAVPINGWRGQRIQWC
jgi:adenosylcobinamide-GDP ribazoletransferase